MDNTNLPRADVSNAALAGALIGLLLLVLTGTPTVAAVASFATVILQFGFAWLLSAPYKLHANFLAGALVAVAVGVYSIRTGLPYNEAAFQQNLVALVTFLLNVFLPAKQP